MTQLHRLPDWEQRLAEYLASKANARFCWGREDCALFAAGAVLAVTGQDLAVPFRGRYRTARGAVRALKRFGAGALESTVDQHFERCAPAFVRRGDLVAIAGEGGHALGVAIGHHALFLGEEGEVDGLVRVSRPDWLISWRVG